MALMRKTGRTAAVLMGVAGIAIGTAPMAGADILTTPPPTGEATGVAVQIPGVITVGGTSATAGSSTGSATGTALQLGSVPPPTQLGGTQSGPGTSSGALLDTGATPLGRVQLTPWSAMVASSSTQRTADASAAAARVALPDPSVASVDVLQSSSHAENNGAASAGSSSSDGAVVELGGSLTLRLLHAEASSSGTRQSYLLGVDDTHIATSDVVNRACVIAVPDILRLVCLDASGGLGKSASEVLQLVVGGQGGLRSDVVAATTSGGTGTNVLPATLLPSGTVGETARGAAHGGQLPFTGGELWFTLAVGIAVLSLGASVTLLGRLRPALA